MTAYRSRCLRGQQDLYPHDTVVLQADDVLHISGTVEDLKTAFLLPGFRPNSEQVGPPHLRLSRAGVWRRVRLPSGDVRAGMRSAHR